MTHPHENCIDCEVHATPCPPASRRFGDTGCWERGETGACEHTIAIRKRVAERMCNEAVR
jgi:hypothetical protein